MQSMNDLFWQVSGHNCLHMITNFPKAILFARVVHSTHVIFLYETSPMQVIFSQHYVY